MPEQKAKTPKPLCFVVGPIGPAGSDIRKHADMVLHSVLKEVLESEELGYKVKRADEDPRPGMIGDRVIHDILNAELVVADLTDLNPNAFYELGIRHLSERPAIHIAREGTALPFDNLGHDTIFVDVSNWHSIVAARRRLLEAAKSIKEQDFRVSNPITQAKASIDLKSSSDPKDKLLADMRESISELQRSIIQGPSGINRIVRKNHKNPSADDIVSEALMMLRDKEAPNKVVNYLAQRALDTGYILEDVDIEDGCIVGKLGAYRFRIKLDGSGASTLI